MGVQHSTDLRVEDHTIFSGDRCVGVAYGWDSGDVRGAGSVAIAKTNATLWAASPKLLGALLKLEEAARFASIADPHEREEVRLALEEAGAAIIEARGC
jgi:hypothetical protein